jgi:hypothetical protein
MTDKAAAEVRDDLLRLCEAAERFSPPRDGHTDEARPV